MLSAIKIMERDTYAYPNFQADQATFYQCLNRRKKSRQGAERGVLLLINQSGFKSAAYNLLDISLASLIR
jgi:hypothetical protein